MSSPAEQRRSVLREVLLAGAAASQKDLLRKLAQRGLRATQPVLSRDLRQLGAVKRDGAYVLLAEERITPLAALRILLRGASAAGPHLVVVRCEAGAASAVARALEAEGLPGVAGTVAGDDTVFVAVRSQAAAAGVRKRIASLI